MTRVQAMFALLLATAGLAPVWAEAPAPKGIEPLAAERQAALADLVAATASIRGLQAPERLLTGQQGAAASGEFFDKAVREGLTDEVLPGMQRSLEWFGLVPAGTDLRAVYADLLSSQVAGYFDTDSGYLVVVDGAQTDFSGEFSNPELVERLDNAIMVHEISHAVQHEHYDLDRLTPREVGISDAAVATAALVEGDATMVMYSYMFGVPFERMRASSGIMRQMLADPSALIEMSPDLPGTEELLAAPEYIRETMLFPYLWGLLFCAEVQGSGGHKLLNYAFETDPPVSTEQILHPEKWLGQRDQPVEIDVPTTVEGFRLLQSGTWGEFGIRMILAQRLPEVDVEDRLELAAGWGGDRFALYESQHGEMLVWAIEWDSAADALAFRNAARKAFRGWSIRQAGPTRIVLFDRTGRKSRAEKSIWRGFATARAIRSDVAAPDFAAIGITEADVLPPMTPGDYLKLMQDPVLAELFAESAKLLDDDSMKAMLEDPEFRQMMDEMMDDPAIEEHARAAMEAADMPPTALAEGVFSIPALGITIDLPAGARWTHTTHPQSGAAIATESDSNAAVSVMLLPIPAVVPLSSIGLGMQLQFEKEGMVQISAGESVLAGQPAYLAIYEKADNGLVLDLWVVRAREFGLTISLVKPPGISPDLVSAMQGVIDSVTFAAPL